MFPLNTAIEADPLPHQTVRERFATSGERRLLHAVLQDGLHTLVRSRIDRCSAVYAQELAWLLSDDRSHPFAFLTLCDLLDIDADRLRRRVTADSRGPANVLRVPDRAPDWIQSGQP